MDNPSPPFLGEIIHHSSFNFFQKSYLPNSVCHYASFNIDARGASLSFPAHYVGHYTRSRQRTPNIVYTQVDRFQWVLTSSHMRPIKSHFSHFISWLEITCEMWRVHSKAKSLASIFIARAVSSRLQKVIPLSAT